MHFISDEALRLINKMRAIFEPLFKVNLVAFGNRYAIRYNNHGQTRYQSPPATRSSKRLER